MSSVTGSCLSSHSLESEKININSELYPSKCDAFEHEFPASPNSTEFTENDTSELQLETKGSNQVSARYLAEISTFEPLIDSFSSFYNDLKFNNNLLVLEESTSENKQIENQSSQELITTKELYECPSTEIEDDENETQLKGWTEKRDKVLKTLASKCKYDWKKICKKFNTNEKSNYTPVELKAKYRELAKISIPLRIKFTHQEDLLIAKYFDLYGCDWNQISTHFSDRTPMMLKNRYYSYIRKKNLLNNMLEEVNEKDLISYTKTHQISEYPEDDFNTLTYLSNSHKGLKLEKLPISSFVNLFQEFDNPFPIVLHEKITIES